MMIAFQRTIAILGCLLAVLLTLALRTGQAAPAHRGIVPIDACTPPCLLNVRPGEAAPDQAISTLRALFPNQRYRVEHRSYTVFTLNAVANARNVPGVTMERMDAFDVLPVHDSGRRLEITITSAQGSVTAISVDGRQAPDLMPTVGDVVSTYGAPDCVIASPISLTSSPALLYAGAAGRSLLLVSIRGDFRYTDRIHEMLAFTNPRLYPNCRATQARRWR